MKSAGHPLPANGIAGNIAVQQVVVHPAGRYFPVCGATVTGQEARYIPDMIMHVACFLQLCDGLVDDPDARVAVQDG